MSQKLNNVTLTIEPLDNAVENLVDAFFVFAFTDSEVSYIVVRQQWYAKAFILSDLVGKHYLLSPGQYIFDFYSSNGIIGSNLLLINESGDYHLVLPESDINILE